MIRRAAISALWAALALAARTATAAQWRVYTAADGLGASSFRFVTIAEDGAILGASDAASFCQYDGYKARASSSPAAGTGRFYQSPSGQLWTAAAGNLWTMTGGAWTSYPIAQITAQTPLCPVRQNTVLCLLPDRLVEFNATAGQPRVTTLLDAGQTRLGQFMGLTIGAEEETWVTGETGVLRAAGPKRTLTASSAWQEFSPPPAAGLVHFQHPEPDAGGLTMVAERADHSGPAVAHFDGQQWEIFPTGATPVLFAWRDAQGGYWAGASNALLQFQNGLLTTNHDLSPRQYRDAAVDWRGNFWLATSDGLVRFSPALWESSEAAPDFPPRFEPGALKPILPLALGQDATVACYLTTRTGDVWVGGNFGAARRRDRWTIFPASDPLAPKQVTHLVELPDGRIWCASRDKIWQFDGRQWFEVRGGFDHITAMIGGRDGSIWVGTARGAQRFTRGNWIENGAGEGLESGNILDMNEDVHGAIWADTPRGWRKYHPEADSDPPQTYIDSKSGAEGNVPENGAITLTFHGRDRWNMTPPARLLYSHRLDEREWSAFTDSTNMNFSDLAAGKHYFQVRAMDSAGNIDPDPPHWEFALALPWYEEGRLVLIASAGGGAALFFALLAWKRHRQLLRSYARVEEQVAERTRQLGLANQELVQSQKMRALGTLAAGIAHDFNNILSIIKGSAQIIEANPRDGEKVRGRVDRIKSMVDQGSAVVQALLGFSRGGDDMVAACEVNPVVENTLRLLGDRFVREVEIQFDKGPGLARVRVAPSLAQQILLNFIFNAAESMNGRKKIVIRTASSPPSPDGLALPPGAAAGYVAVTVSDSGCGIDPENLPRVFEPFFTTKALSTRRGTGLGLSVAYELARKMEAGLAVQSTVGHGSAFSLILPAAQASP